MSNAVRLLVLLTALPAVQDGGPPSGYVVERQVRLKVLDLAGRSSEIHRIERLVISGGNLSIEDLTFGQRLIVRPDRGAAWVIDTVRSTYSEVTFEECARRRAEAVRELREARDRVAGTADEKDIDTILMGLGELPPDVEVALRDTGRVEEIDGRSCREREVRIGPDIQHFAAFVDPQWEGALAYVDALARVGAFHPKVAEQLRRLGGFPVKGRSRYALFLDRVISDEEVRSIGRAAVSDRDFDLPAGLRKVPLPRFQSEEARKPEKPR